VPLAALPHLAHVFSRRVLYELVGFRVYGIVGQVHLHLFHILFSWLTVLLSAKAKKSFFVHLNPEWIDTGHQKLHADVELEALDQHRFVDLLLDHR